jgi:hypothetical protein
VPQLVVLLFAGLGVEFSPFLGLEVCRFVAKRAGERFNVSSISRGLDRLVGFDPSDILNVLLVIVTVSGSQQASVSFFEVELTAPALSPVPDDISAVAENLAGARS